MKNVSSNSGIALPMAVMIIAIISLLGFAAVYLVDSQTVMTSEYKNQESAFYYAEAGIHDYIWQMNQDPYFYIDTGEISSNYGKGYYVVKYVNTSSDPGQPGKKLITIRSTGWTQENPHKRATIEATLKLRSFSEYMIFTNYEGTQAVATPKNYASSTYDSLRGNWTMWKTGETASGPIHTNDTVHIMATDRGTGPTFNGRVTYSNHMKVYDSSQEIPPTLYCLDDNKYNDGHISPKYNGGKPTWTPKMDLPVDNKSLKTLAQKSGLYLQGRTCIYLDGDKIIYTNHKDPDPIKRAEIPKTLKPGDDLYPANGVIYVDNLGGSSKWDLKRGNAFISGKLSGRLTVAAANDIYITGSNPTNYSTSSKGYSEGGIYYVNSSGQITHSLDSRAMLGLIANGNIYVLHTGWPSSSGGQHDNISGNDCWFVAPNNLYIDAVLFSVTGSFSLENYNQNEPPSSGSTTLQEHLGKIYLYGSLIQNTENYIGRYAKSALNQNRYVYVSGKGWKYVTIKYETNKYYPHGIYDPANGYFPDPDYDKIKNYNQTTGYTKNYQFDQRLLNISPPHIMDPEKGGWVLVNWQKIAPDYGVQP